MKNIEQLRKLVNNPFYKMSDEELQALDDDASQEVRVSSVSVDAKKKIQLTNRDGAAVKETGRINKHSSDPVTE